MNGRKLPSETELLTMVRALSQESRKHVTQGIGDDAAVLKASAGCQVYSVDSAVEGIHFLRYWLTPEELAYRSFAAAISDLSAMGARPRGFLCHLSLPPETTRQQMQRFFAEQERLAHDYACPLIGGNISSAKEWTIVTNVIGEVPKEKKPLLRSGAKPGDEVWLVGDVGKARLGLTRLLKLPNQSTLRFHPKRRKDVVQPLSAFLKPSILLNEGQRLLSRAHACLDISDGLSRDVGRLAEESGVTIRLNAEALISTWDAQWQRFAEEQGESPLTSMLIGGEDYSLVACGPAQKRPRFAQVIGSVHKGSPQLEVMRGNESIELPSGHAH